MMDNIREKLVELLLAVDSVCNKGECGDCGAENCFIYRAADHLIRHGVTVQEWIPVSERLPEEGEEVLSYRGSGCRVESLESISRNYWEEDMFSYYPVTHWQPLPKPPKGE